MNSILEIIDKRNLHMYLIMFKIYLDTRGKTDTGYSGNIEKELEELLEDEYNYDSFCDAKQYLISENLVADKNVSRLSVTGRRDFEDWINEFATLDHQSKINLTNNLPNKVTQYLGITKDAISTLKSAKDLFEFLNN